MDEFERSGLSGPKFSQVSGVCYQTFASWMLKRRRARGEYDSSSVPLTARKADCGPALMRWVEAETGITDGSAGVSNRSLDPESGAVIPLTVKLGGGVTVEVCHEGQLSLVVELARRLNSHFEKPC